MYISNSIKYTYIKYNKKRNKKITINYLRNTNKSNFEEQTQ